MDEYKRESAAIVTLEDKDYFQLGDIGYQYFAKNIEEIKGFTLNPRAAKTASCDFLSLYKNNEKLIL